MIELDKSYLFHTSLGIWLGRVVAATPDFVTLNTASWIPDQGRMNECVARGTYNECEPIGDGVMIQLGGVVIVPWRHPLPTTVK
jgi:hypothetical protein